MTDEQQTEQQGERQDEQQEPTEGKPKGRKRVRKDAGLTPVQLRTVAYLADVGLATERGIYRQGVSDATKRTLKSLQEAGLVASRRLGDFDAVLYHLTSDGQRAVDALRSLVTIS